MKINKNDYTIIAKELTKELIDKITGNDEEWLFGKIPSKNVMIGMIDGASMEESILKNDDSSNNRFETIPSIGLRFRVSKNCSDISIILKGKLFYRTRPSFEEQQRFILEKYSKKEDKIFLSPDELIKYLEEKKKDIQYIEEKEQLVNIYKSINLESLGEFRYKPGDDLDLLNKQIEEQLIKVIDAIKMNSFCYKPIWRNVSSFLNLESFKTILSASEMNAIPNWNIKLHISYDDYEKYKEIVVQLVNNTNKIAKAGSYETAIFNGGLKIKSNVDFLPIQLNSLKYYYTDNPTLPALGNNCTVIKKDNYIETENIPIYYQNRVITIDKFNSYVEFAKLVEDPISNLKYIHREMNKKLNEYKKDLENIKNIVDSTYLNSFGEEISEFEHEIRRFYYGIELIENKSDVRQAFKLMNETFALNKKYIGWRMFQIVFIVSEIADMINCEYHGTPNFDERDTDIDNVDLIYFPTGGGKTETFLGCVIFSAFFDRIRGKENGATAIIKYPLRLLAAQQLDRVLVLTINANKTKEKYQLTGDQFSVGFFTGSKNTPNEISEKKLQEINSLPQETKNNLYRQIDICPICKKEMNVSFDASSWKLTHVCSDPNCGFIPPIYIVDDEIYRFAPTFIISTIDKMANIGTSMGFKSLFGQSKNRCHQHGFLKYNDKCYVNKCKCSIDYDIERKDPIPTLSIQDELHLVNESLGTFDSHYESLIQYYCENLVPKEQRKKIKFIGATATISDYQRHIRGLYNKNAKKFPTSVKKENFYSKTDENDISRIIVGAALYGGSITDSIQKMVTLFRIIVSKWMVDCADKLQAVKELGFSGDENTLLSILHNYLISIIYNNSKNDAGTIRAVLENQGSNMLRSENVQDFDIAEITGDVEFKTIKNVMHDVESDSNKYNTKNVIVATSAISHGVDEDCFNQIFFFGMPNQTSEYIQAYSRVGRAYTGIVFDVFRIIRDRDKSYLKNFYNFHQYKDLLINPVPINRYAKNAIYSTLPGIFAALLYQHYVKKSKAIEVTKLINSGGFNLETILEDIKQIYDCNFQDSKLYEEIIVFEVTKMFNAFKNNTSSEITIADLIRNSNSKHKGPMTNLRDVDIPLEIEMKGD